MFDHVKFGVSNYPASKRFFLAALEPLGFAVVSEGAPAYGIELGPGDETSLCLFESAAPPAQLHLAFTARTRQQVDVFHHAAIAAGGRDNGAPGLRPNYHANYYAAFVIAPDGHNVDAVCHEPEKADLASGAAALAARLIRNVDDAPAERLVREPHYDSTGARLARGTAARKLGASVDTLAPGKLGCPYHLHHAQEEMFVVLAGEGTLRVAGELLPLRTGDVVFIPAGPEYPHQIINTSAAPLKYLSVSTQETPEICEYPDSGKFLAQARNGAVSTFDIVQAKGESLDYWEREP